MTYPPCLQVAIFSYIYWNLLQIDSPALCFAVICTAGFSSGVCGIMLSIYIDSPHLHSALALIPYSALGIGEKTVNVTTGLHFLSVICRQSKTVRACLHLLSDSDLSNYVNNWKHHSVVCPRVIYPQVSLICIRTKISRASMNYAIVQLDLSTVLSGYFYCLYLCSGLAFYRLSSSREFDYLMSSLLPSAKIPGKVLRNFSSCSNNWRMFHIIWRTDVAITAWNLPVWVCSFYVSP